MKAVFFSDAHLLGNDIDRTRRVSDFIQEVSLDADIVFILGDLFEFYHGYEGYIFPSYRPITELLRELTKEKPVYFMEGNHEFDMGLFFQSYTGVVCRRSMELYLDDNKIFLSHGDEFSCGRLGRFLRSRFTYAIMDALGPTLTWSIAMCCRPFLSKSVKPYNKHVLGKYRMFGQRKLEEGYDAVIFGHSHMADLFKFEYNGKKKTYMNTGDLTALFTYGTYTTEEGFRLLEYEKTL